MCEEGKRRSTNTYRAIDRAGEFRDYRGEWFVTHGKGLDSIGQHSAKEQQAACCTAAHRWDEWPASIISAGASSQSRQRQQRPAALEPHCRVHGGGGCDPGVRAAWVGGHEQARLSNEAAQVLCRQAGAACPPGQELHSNGEGETVYIVQRSGM